MIALPFLLISAAAVIAHAADDGSAEQFLNPNPILLAVGLLAVVVTGVGLAVAQTPADKRSEMWMVKTKLGMEPLHEVIVPNLMPALTVTLVSIPLSLALGIATGASPMAGIATAVIGGLVSGSFGSSAFNIVGPAGALVGILMKFTERYGEEILPWLALISAAMIVLTTVLRLHEYCMFMPKAVFEGFTVSVALTIGLGQMEFAFGLDSPKPLKVEGLELSPGIFKLAGCLNSFLTLQTSTTVLFLVSMAALQIAYKVKPSVPWMVPFAVVACLFGLVCVNGPLCFIPLEIKTLQSKYGTLNFWLAQGLKPLNEIVLEAADKGGSYGDIFAGSISVTIVAVLETLISAKIAQTRSKMPFDTDQELQGLALSHAACGLCGVMPPTGVFVRTSVNFATGATHRTSQFFQGIFVLIFAAVCMQFLSYIPLGAVAAILVTASIRMVPWPYVGQLWAEQKWWFGLLAVTALLCWLVDSVVGLAVGTVVALLVTGKETARGHAEISITAASKEQLPDGTPKMIAIDALALDDVNLGKAERDSDSDSESDSEDSSELPSIAHSRSYAEMQRETKAFKRKASSENPHSHLAAAPEFDYIQRPGVDGDDFDRLESATTGIFRDEDNEHLRASVRGDRVFLYKFLGQLDFLNGDRHADRVQAMIASEPKAVVIAMQNVPWIDPDGMEALREMINMLEEKVVRVYIACPRPKVARILEKEAWYQKNDVFSTEKSALLAAAGDDSSNAKFLAA